MKACMCWNYLSIHQIDVADSFFRLLGNDFRFVSCQRPSGMKAGLADYENRPYVVHAYEEGERETIQRLIQDADLCLLAPYEPCWSIAKTRRLPTFISTERIFKSEKREKGVVPTLRLAHIHMMYRNFSKNGSYLLCNSYGTKEDFLRAKLFGGRCLRWGYFPKVERGPRSLGKGIRLLWSGRCVQLKHPELAIDAFRYLKSRGYPSVEMDLVLADSGEREKFLLDHQDSLKDPLIRVHGTLPHEALIDLMRSANMFLFTSDGREGFGAVLYEAMATGCCCIADAGAGATRLISKDRETAIHYHGRESFCEVLEWTASHLEEARAIGARAEQFIAEEYSAETAAKNLIAFVENGYCNSPKTREPGSLF